MRRFCTILSILLLSAISGSGIAIADDKVPSATIQGRIDNLPAIKVYSGQVELTVNGNESESFAIYSITGQMVKSMTLSSGSEIVDLPQGCYIVKCSKWSKKIIVR